MNFNNKKEYSDFVQIFEDVPKDGRSGYDRCDECYRAFLVGDCATDIFLDMMTKAIDLFPMFRIGCGGKNKVIIGLADKWNPVIRVDGRCAKGIPKTFCDKMLFDIGKEVTFYLENKEIGKCTWEEFSDVEIRVLD